VVLISLFWEDLAGTRRQASRKILPGVIVACFHQPPHKTCRPDQRIAALLIPADEQVKAVMGWLKERNPGFDGKGHAQTEGGMVTDLRFLTDQVYDIFAPCESLRELHSL